MNAIISLCHFCELHGPSVLFCTQAFHSHDPLQFFDKGIEGESSLEHSLGSFLTPDRESGLPPSLQYSVLGSAPVSPQIKHVSMNFTKTSDTCEGCSSFVPGQPGLISNDHEAKVSYLSSQYPNHPQVFTMVRQACVRSLSCEVCPGREGPIFFGDDHQGYVLSYTFFIKDSVARGFNRWYSIIVVMMDKIYLLNSWPFLVSHIRKVITNLQERANIVYEQEQKKCPQRALRLKTSMTPANFTKLRGGNKPARSIVELTAYKKVFRFLHQSFTWLLKVGSNRLSERLLEGPPTEDSIIDLEKQEETEEGFVKLFSKKVVVNENSDENNDQAVFIEEEIEDDTQVFTNIRHVYKVLGADDFQTVAHHTIIGNQIIIRGKSKHLIVSLIDSLKTLLPRGCWRIIYYSSDYEDSWKCNFLGLPYGLDLPVHASLYVVIDIEESSFSNVNNAGIPLDDCFDALHGYKFNVFSPVEMPEKEPTLLKLMAKAVSNEKLANSVITQWLISLKEEWMNKVKVLFKFTKAGGNRSDEDTHKLMTIVNTEDQDKAVLKFWMTGLSIQYRNHLLSSAIQQSVDKSWFSRS